ncbi:MAG: ABC transporter substrate-binding protein [Acidobacteria bacterium]|nr:ABC transporter substrate-binding protein [Acidobacteriota bacterium]
MKPQRLFLVLALVVLLVLGVVIIYKKYSRTNGPTTQRVVIAQAGDFFLYAPLYVALDAGFFKEEGLDVSIVTTGGDDKTWAAVISNSAQFGVADPTFVVASSERGQPGKVVASIVNGVPFWGVTWRTDLKPISSGADLKNLKVATFQAPSTAYVLQEKMFKDAGLPANISQGSFGSLLTMVRANRADIALELEPNVSQAVNDGAKVLYSMKDVYGDFAITGLTATPKFIEANPTVVAEVTCALQKAMNLIRQDQNRVLSILLKRFSDTEPQVAREALRRVTNDGIIPASVVTSEAAWQKAVAVRLSAGDFSNPGTFSTFVDNNYAERAVSTCKSN